MPEWTGKTREKVYGLLSGGRLDETFAVIRTFPKFKQADMKPVDAKALASFDEKLGADDNLQALLAHASINDSECIRRFGLFLLGQLRPLNANHFIDCLFELVDRIAKPRALQFKNHDYPFELCWKEPAQKLAYTESGKELTADDIITWFGLNMGWFETNDKKLVQGVVEAICTSPSRANLAILEREWNSETRPQYKSLVLETERVISLVLRKKYEKALAAVEKANQQPVKPEPDSRSQSMREQLHAFMAGGNLDALKQFIESMPKMSAAQVKALCENIPDRAKDVLRKQAKLEMVFDWMQDTGALGQISAEWIDQGEWPQNQERIIKWMIDTARARRTWERQMDDRFILVSETKPLKLNRHLEILARHFDSNLICAILRVFPDGKEFGRDHSRLIFYYVRQELAANLLRQVGLDAAQRKLDEIGNQPVDEDPRVISEYGGYVRGLKREAELSYYAADPVREVMYFQEPLYVNELIEDKIKFLRVATKLNEPVKPGYLDYFSERDLWVLWHDPKYREKTVARVAAWMQEADTENLDKAFKLLMLDPEKVAGLGYNLTELTAHALWHIKSSEVNRAILRMRALVERGVCNPAEAAGLIEQTFASEEPATWRAAAEAIVALRKLDPKINLTQTERIKELIARDPAKYGKFLSPLSDGGKDGAKK